jgi:quercetin dioxygenase-like cupin family protein
MELYDWSAIAEEKMNPTLSRQVIHTGPMTIARIWLGKGAIVPLHQHVNQQVSMVESGALQFDMADGSVILHAGDVVVIPPDMPHRVEALEESRATDLFTPQREDWIRGDDAYLRVKQPEPRSNQPANLP